KLRIAEHLPPREVSDRGSLRGSGLTAKLLRQLARGPLVIRTDLETAKCAENAVRFFGRGATRDAGGDEHDEQSPGDHRPSPLAARVTGASAGNCSMTACCFRPRDSPSIITNRAGIKKIAKPVENIMPTIVTVPIRRLASAPAPRAAQSGAKPRMN